jgi:site-specific DNA recombinase
MKKYAGYVRVSTEEQVSGYGIEAQKASIESYAAAMGYELDRIYTDEGVSGAKLDRPAFNMLREEVKKGTYAGVIVFKLDRISRMLKDILIIKDDEFEPNDTAIISVKEQFDTSTAIGRLFFQMIGSFAEFEREVIKERMTSGKAEKAKQGKFAGGSAPYGYNLKDGELLVNEREAAVVKKVFAMRAAKMTLQAIADYLNQNRIPTKRGGRWSKVHIRDMINREPFYNGQYKHGNVISSGVHQPILKTILA